MQIVQRVGKAAIVRQFYGYGKYMESVRDFTFKAEIFMFYIWSNMETFFRTPFFIQFSSKKYKAALEYSNDLEKSQTWIIRIRKGSFGNGKSN